MVLPELGESVTEGTVTRWLKAVGDEVAVDEPLLEISTDKVDTEIPSPVAGTLLEIKADEDETVEVGAELAIIGEAGPHLPRRSRSPRRSPNPSQNPSPKRNRSRSPRPEPEKKHRSPSPPRAPRQPPEPEKASTPPPAPSRPHVRHVRRRHPERRRHLRHPDRAQAGQAARRRPRGRHRHRRRRPHPQAGRPRRRREGGTGGCSVAAAPAPRGTEPSPLRGKTEKLSRLRKTIATRMVESLQVSAQLTQVHEVDVTEIARLRARQKDAFLEREGVKLTFLPFFAKAAIEALKSHPMVNAALDIEAGTVTYPSGEHLGVAVDTERGLLVPTIRDAGDLSIAGLARKIADVAERTRTNKISPDEISGATFTITNLGSNGALFDTPIINQPQVAILGVGAVVKRPVVMTDDRGGESIAVRSMAYLALTYDHRIIDGADAGASSRRSRSVSRTAPSRPSWGPDQPACTSSSAAPRASWARRWSRHLREQGHQVTRLVRSGRRARPTRLSGTRAPGASTRSSSTAPTPSSTCPARRSPTGPDGRLPARAARVPDRHHHHARPRHRRVRQPSGVLSARAWASTAPTAATRYSTESSEPGTRVPLRGRPAVGGRPPSPPSRPAPGSA